jgi:hypothetical protein
MAKSKKKETTTANIASHSHKLGGDPKEGKCGEGYMWDADTQTCVRIVEGLTQMDIHMKAYEATVSGTGVSATPNVAGTDTRFGAPTFEPNYFDKKSDTNNMFHNEMSFWDDANTQILLKGFEYADGDDPYSNMDQFRFTDKQKKNTKAGSTDAVDWDLDFEGRHANLLKKLQKVHNT